MKKSNPTLPRILAKKVALQSRIFTVEALSLQFNNGVKAEYERMVSSPNGAVLIVAVLEGHFVLIKEYAAGLEHYELTFPKGKVDPGEGWAEAAKRESMEEIGFLPKQVRLLDTVSLASGYMTHKTHIVLAEDLLVQSAEGDEPEPLEVIHWPISDWKNLLKEPCFTEGRSYAAVMIYLIEKGLI